MQIVYSNRSPRPFCIVFTHILGPLQLLCDYYIVNLSFCQRFLCFFCVHFYKVVLCTSSIFTIFNQKRTNIHRIIGSFTHIHPIKLYGFIPSLRQNLQQPPLLHLHALLSLQQSDHPGHPAFHQYMRLAYMQYQKYQLTDNLL